MGARYRCVKAFREQGLDFGRLFWGPLWRRGHTGRGSTLAPIYGRVGPDGIPKTQLVVLLLVTWNMGRPPTIWKDPISPVRFRAQAAGIGAERILID